MKKFNDYILGFLSVVLFVLAYTGSYATWRSQYPAQRVEVCDTNDWVVDLPSGTITKFYSPIIEIDRKFNCCNTDIRVGTE
jgi:hypothetical protein